MPPGGPLLDVASVVVRSDRPVGNDRAARSVLFRCQTHNVFECCTHTPPPEPSASVTITQ